MNTEYLNKVLIYLQQELPENYRGHIKLNGEKLTVTIPDTINFGQAYEALHEAIVNSIERVRIRQIDLEFIIKSKVQQRDFKILK